MNPITITTRWKNKPDKLGKHPPNRTQTTQTTQANQPHPANLVIPTTTLFPLLS